MEWVGVGAGLPCGLTLPKVPYCSYLTYSTLLRYLQVDVVARRGCLGTRRHGRKDATHHFRHESAMIESTMLAWTVRAGAPPEWVSTTTLILPVLLITPTPTTAKGTCILIAACRYYLYLLPVTLSRVSVQAANASSITCKTDDLAQQDWLCSASYRILSAPAPASASVLDLANLLHSLLLDQ